MSQGPQAKKTMCAWHWREKTRCLRALLVAVCWLLGGCQAAEYNLNWTAQGVMQYSSTPLEVMFGDEIKLACQEDIHSNVIYSNVIYVKDQEQYDDCDSTKGDRRSMELGQCLQASTIISLTIERRASNQNSGRVNYQLGLRYYFYSASDGTFASTVSNGPYLGGQCLDGLKMILTVVESPETPTTNMTNPRATPTEEPKTGQKSGGGGGQSFPINIVIAVVGGIAFIVVVLIVAVLFILCKRKSNKVAINSEEVVPNDPNASLTRTSLIQYDGHQSEKSSALRVEPLGSEGEIKLKEDGVGVSFKPGISDSVSPPSGRKPGKLAPIAPPPGKPRVIAPSRSGHTSGGGGGGGGGRQLNSRRGNGANTPRSPVKK